MAVYAFPVSERIVSDKIYFIEANSERDAQRRAASGEFQEAEEISPARVQDRLFGSMPPAFVQKQHFRNPEGPMKCDTFRREISRAAAASLAPGCGVQSLRS